MAKKSTRPYPLNERTKWNEFWLSVWNGSPLQIEDIAITGIINSGLKRKITISINNIIKQESINAFKIGKTGDAQIRTDKKDYRADYSTMYLLYKSTSKENISSIEVDYIKKYKKTHKDKIDNIIEHKAGKMFSYDGYYYLYIVVR